MVGTAVERILPDEVDHEVSKSLRQRLERTNVPSAAAQGTLASPTKQVWQNLGTNFSDLAPDC